MRDTTKLWCIRIFCYKVMSFRLKNAGVIYQRLVNKMFAAYFSSTIKVYIDDMLVKSLHAKDHTSHLKQEFEVLDQHQMKLNLKCTFGVGSGHFLGYLITQRGIELNLQHIRALIDMPSLKSIKEVQRLKGRIAALSRFISKIFNHCISFFKALKGEKNFEWT